MDNKDQRNASVPLGTFNQDRNGTGPDASHDASMDASSDQREVGRDNSADNVTGAYERADDLQLQPIDDTPIDFGTTRPGRKRVRTLLGVSLPDANAVENRSASERSENITNAIQHMLDSQNALEVAIDIDFPEERADPTLVVAESDLTEVVDAPARTTTQATTTPFDDFETRPTHPTAPLPLLIPSQYFDAQARDREPASVTSAIDTVTLPVVSPAKGAAASVPPANISSLAPREVSRPVNREEPNRGLGFLMVAAMALIAVGGWFVTSGSFSRLIGSHTPTLTSAPQNTVAAAAQPPAAPSEPVSAPNVAQSASPMPPPIAEAPPPAAPSVAVSSGENAGAKKPLTATSHRPRAKSAPKLVPGAAGDLPEAPTRGEVVQRLESVRPSVRACAAGLSGVADLDITIAHSGAVMHVLVGGDFAGTTQGSCIARAVREARFSSFKQERFRLLFPYAI